MRPLFKALFVLSIFALLAAHVSNGVLHNYNLVPEVMAFIDNALRTLLINPLGREYAVYALLALGGACAFMTYIGSERGSAGNRHSTW